MAVVLVRGIYYDDYLSFSKLCAARRLKVSNRDMNLPKKFMGRFFFVTAFVGAMYGAYLNMRNISGVDYIPEDLMIWIYWSIWIAFCASWYMLFDYNNENLQKKNR